MVEAELEGMLLDRLPTMAEIVGAQARRDLGAGEILTTAAVVVPPVVKSGDQVKVSLSTGAIQVSGVGRASRQRSGGRFDPRACPIEPPRPQGAHYRTWFGGDRSPGVRQ